MARTHICTVIYSIINRKMETQEQPNANFERRDRRYRDHRRYRDGRTFSGLIIVVVGTLLLARAVGVYFPSWLMSWPMFLIALGFYIGVRHHFRNPGFLIPMAIGGIMLTDMILPEADL